MDMAWTQTRTTEYRHGQKTNTSMEVYTDVGGRRSLNGDVRSLILYMYHVLVYPVSVSLVFSMYL